MILSTSLVGVRIMVFVKLTSSSPYFAMLPIDCGFNGNVSSSAFHCTTAI